MLASRPISLNQASQIAGSYEDLRRYFEQQNTLWLFNGSYLLREEQGLALRSHTDAAEDAVEEALRLVASGETRLLRRHRGCRSADRVFASAA